MRPVLVDSFHPTTNPRAPTPITTASLRPLIPTPSLCDLRLHPSKKTYLNPVRLAWRAIFSYFPSVSPSFLVVSQLSRIYRFVSTAPLALLLHSTAASLCLTLSVSCLGISSQRACFASGLFPWPAITNHKDQDTIHQPSRDLRHLLFFDCIKPFPNFASLFPSRTLRSSSCPGYSLPSPGNRL